MPSHTNIAWQIFQGLETILKANIADAHIENVYRFPDEDNVRDYVAKYGRAILIKLENDEQKETWNDNYIERYYQFSMRIFVRYVAEEQKDLMNLSEEVKYWCHQNLPNSPTWTNINVLNVEYIEPDEITNARQANLSVRVFRDG